MELRHLRYFVAVAEELHFGRAAERLFIVQPALSKQISALERELGVRLLERTRRYVELTPAGTALLADARRIIAAADGAVARAQAAGRGEVGELRLGFIAPALYDLVPRAVRSFRDDRPGVRLVLAEMHNQDALDAVAAGRLDLAFVRLPITTSPGLSVTTVAKEPIMLAVPRDHRLAERSEVAVAELADEDLVLIARSLEPDLHGYYVELCAAAGFRPRVAHEVDRTHVGVGLVACGLGVSFVPCSSRLVGHPGVTYLPLAPSPVLRIGAVWATATASPVLCGFLARLPGGRP